MKQGSCFFGGQRLQKKSGARRGPGPFSPLQWSEAAAPKKVQAARRGLGLTFSAYFNLPNEVRQPLFLGGGATAPKINSVARRGPGLTFISFCKGSWDSSMSSRDSCQKWPQAAAPRPRPVRPTPTPEKTIRCILYRFFHFIDGFLNRNTKGPVKALYM